MGAMAGRFFMASESWCSFALISACSWIRTILSYHLFVLVRSLVFSLVMNGILIRWVDVEYPDDIVVHVVWEAFLYILVVIPAHISYYKLHLITLYYNYICSPILICTQQWYLTFYVIFKVLQTYVNFITKYHNKKIFCLQKCKKLKFMLILKFLSSCTIQKLLGPYFTYFV